MTLRATRTTAFALFCLAAAMGSIAPAMAQNSLDTTRLPRIGGNRMILANPPHTSFVSPESVARTIEVTRALLTLDGWQEYGRPFSASSDNPSAKQLDFKKGMQGLSVFIAVAPAQANATGVGYTALLYAVDLPFPKDAAEILYSPERPHMEAVTPTGIEDTMEFFRKELTALGWTLWSIKDRAPQTAGNAASMSDKGAYAYYARDDKRLFLTAKLRDDSRIKVELKGIPRESAVAEKPPEPAPTPRVERPKPAADDLADDIQKQIRAEIAKALAGINQPAQPRPAPAAQATETLRAQANTDAPIPLPESAEAVEVEGAKGEVEFTSPSSVSSLAAFYRSQLKPLGWQERATPINRPNMVVLDFSKGGKKINFTIMQMGKSANVRANGSGLVTETAAREAPGKGSSAREPEAMQDLEAEADFALPVPAKSTLKGTEKTPFRIVLTATVPAGVASVLAFYRRELGKLNWKEDAQGAVVQPDKAVLAYTSPDGPAALKLSRENDDTSVNLALRKTAEAAKAGLLPKTGQVKMMFGNMMPNDATVTINRQTVKVGAGAGAKGADGPSLDLPPGKYKVSFKVGGGPARTEDVEVGANEAWGFLIGPGGGLPLQMY